MYGESWRLGVIMGVMRLGTQHDNVLNRWYVEAPDVEEWISRHRGWILFGIPGRDPALEVLPARPFEALPPPPLVCRYLDAPLDEVARRVPVGLEGEAYAQELRRQIEAATLYRAEISYSIERPPRGPKVLGVCRSIQILSARAGGEITHSPKIPVRDLIRTFVTDALRGTPVNLPRRFGSATRLQLFRVAEVYAAAPPGKKTAAVARDVLPHHTGDTLGGARQLIFQARRAGIIPPAEPRSEAEETEVVLGEPLPSGLQPIVVRRVKGSTRR
jgi:hypothetical protein